MAFALRIVRVSEPSQEANHEHKFAIGRGGHRIDASRNFWEGSGLKIDSASTDVAWGHGLFNNKILTSARNGELIMWDLNKSGVTKYERRTKDHIRSIHKMSVSQVVHHYCITGSADGHMRVWDLRDLSKSIMRVHHPTSVRSLVFSPSLWEPLQAVVGLDNGSIYRWDLKMGQRGQLDKLPVAHTASVTTLDWCRAGGVPLVGSTVVAGGEVPGSGLGWLVSAGLDRCVKIWDLTAPGSNTHIPHKPTYTLHPSFAVRRVAWRPGYECEIAIVSSTEYATPSLDNPQPSPSTVSPSLLTRVGSGLGLDSLLTGSSNLENIYGAKEKLNTPDIKTLPAASSLGDAVEIWDARRGWIAKWSVTGSAAEGDIAFGDAHAIWAQHASGTFSQFDLRDTTKPLDAVPRVAATWEATGSIAFVVDRKERWEVPYDDIHPDQRAALELRKHPIKALGDPSARVTSQVAATYAHDFTTENLETFTTLARRYVFEGRDRQEICAYNSGVALSVGHEMAAQVWLLLGACLAQYLPDYHPTPPLSPVGRKAKQIPSPLLPHASPQPSSTTSPYTFPISLNPKAETPSSAGQKISPGRRSTDASLSRRTSLGRTPSTSNSRRLTPTSSASSSPRHPPVSLPPITPRRASFFARRESIDASTLSRSVIRRPSVSTTGQSASPSDKTTSSLRHVGEGVLDDSDSSSGSEEGEGGDETAGANSSEEDLRLRMLTSPNVNAPRIGPVPSPLSRIAGRQKWTEDVGDEEQGCDDDDDTSPSPQSTSDSDSHGSSSPKKRSVSARPARGRNVSRIKSRSRSSTVASLAAPSIPGPRPLMHQDSHSSIRTVTAMKEHEDQSDDGDADSNASVASGSYYRPTDTRGGHTRQKSQAVSEPAVTSLRPPIDVEEEDSHSEASFTERTLEIIKTDEKRFKETSLAALRDALEKFSEEGDIQMCAMMALVASEELRVSPRRVRRFLDEYIVILTRLRLFTCAAYVRKYCEIQDIQERSRCNLARDDHLYDVR
ncbi:hypothetical protein NLJ89_g3787 [Agrocybe chaxingu]|uniref:WD40 repeat-like protein n=1 Tax=Agrocybe chaxingu TaxID=84603 RepID=A0A9W8MWJ6_9AGAR|nr:hypothetical protein NLJ89_g3787 [Agrocybe chaxingu]